MSINANEILRDLDKHAAESNLPIFDNAYVDFAAARLSAFRDSQNWLLIFEVLGFSSREIEFVDDVYAYGSCVEKEGYVDERILFISSLQHPLFDKETNEGIVDWSSWSIKMKDEILNFNPTRDDYASAGIPIHHAPGPGTLSEIELLRYLIHIRLDRNRSS